MPVITEEQYWGFDSFLANLWGLPVKTTFSQQTMQTNLLATVLLMAQVSRPEFIAQSQQLATHSFTMRPKYKTVVTYAYMYIHTVTYCKWTPQSSCNNPHLMYNNNCTLVFSVCGYLPGPEIMYEVQLVVQECMHAVANYVQSR